jgi:ribosomal protein L11 methyltransferase
MSAWFKVTVKVPDVDLQPFCDLALELGVQAVTVTAAEMPEEQPSNADWDSAEDLLRRHTHTTVQLLVSAEQDLDHLFRRLTLHLGLDRPLSFRKEALPDRDWVRYTQQQFTPLKVGDRLWVVPSWHAPVDPAAVNLFLDPGLAFGTGRHPTTRLCLEWLLEHLTPGDTVLDYGCGSGILAIAAAKLGAGTVVGVDTDDQALQATRRNARRNMVELEVCLPHELPGRRFDLVLANILLRPLVALAQKLIGLTRPGGVLVLAGFLKNQVPQIQAAYESGCELIDIAYMDEWARVTGRVK